MSEQVMLWQVDELELSCARSGDGQTTEARTRGGETIARSDGSGTITDAAGAVLLKAQIAFPRGTAGRLEIADGDGQALGSVSIGKHRFGPKALKATLTVADAAGSEAARFEPRDKKGQDVAILAAGAVPLGALRQTGHERGLRRSVTTYRLELDAAADGPLRPLLLATSLRHHALLVTARNHHADR